MEEDRAGRIAGVCTRPEGDGVLGKRGRAQLFQESEPISPRAQTKDTRRTVSAAQTHRLESFKKLIKRDQTQGGFTTRGRNFPPHFLSISFTPLILHDTHDLSTQVWASLSPGPTWKDYLNQWFSNCICHAG